jgi:hypothetical protein
MNSGGSLVGLRIGSAKTQVPNAGAKGTADEGEKREQPAHARGECGRSVSQAASYGCPEASSYISARRLAKEMECHKATVYRLADDPTCWGWLGFRVHLR